MPEKTVTLTQSRLDRIIVARVAATKARLQPRADLADALQAALADSLARTTELEAEVAQLRAEVERLTGAASTPSPSTRTGD